MPVNASVDELPSYERVRILKPGRSISDAELIDHNGEPFKLSDLRGRVALVFFGFTNCPDVCPLTMAKFRQLQDSGSVDLEQVAFVLISVDSERDTPEALKAFLEKFSDQFIGLTGDPARIKAIAKEFSAAFYKGSPTKDSGEYLVSHSQQAFVVDAIGILRAEFYDPSVDAMTGITQALISERHESGADQEN